jgi:hypothetical protein
MTQVTFTNPRTSATYSWPANPSSENALTKQITIERTSNTGNVGATRQQGDDGPLILDWQVFAKTSAMETALWQWYVLSRKQTVYVTDWDGDQYEGQIILLSRQRLLGSPPTYEVQFEVYRCISGLLATAGVTP